MRFFGCHRDSGPAVLLAVALAVLAAPAFGQQTTTPLPLMTPAQPSQPPAIPSAESWKLPDYMASIQAEPAVLNEILSAFLGTLRDRLGALRAALATSDLTALSSALHGIKGSCRQMGAEPLANLAAQAETDLREGKGPPTADLAAHMQAESEAARTAVERWLARV